MPGARLGRGFCDAYRNPLKSSSVIVNGRPDWNVPTPESCQPSAQRLPVNGSSHTQLRISRCRRSKSDRAQFSSGRLWSCSIWNTPSSENVSIDFESV